MKKNVASQKVGAQLISATDGSAFTGSVTVSVTGDAGTQATGSVGSGVCTHEGNGYHTYAPAQAETNYDLIAFTFTGTGAVPVTVQVYTRPTTGLLAPTVADRTLDVSATGEAGVDWGNVGSPTATLALTGTTIATTQKVDIETIKTNPVVNAGTITFPTGATLASTTNITAGTLTTVTNLTNLPAITANWLTATGIASDAFTAAKFAADCITAAKIADGAIDRATFAADTGLQTIRSGTAQAGAAGTITLDASASSTTDFYKGRNIELTGGTGAGQVGLVFSYNGTTKVATMYNNWVTTPDNTTTFAVQGTYGHGVNSSLQAVSDVQGIGGTAGSNVSGLSSLGTAYGAGTLTTNITGTLSTVTTLTNLPAITSNWLTAAGLAADAVAEIADGVWDEVQSGHTTAGTFGKYLDAQVSTVGGGTAASIADAVWDEVLSGHLTAGSTGYALNAAGSAGDPWSTTLPGSYTGSTAGFIIGTMRAATFAVQFPIISDDNSFEMVIGDDYYAADGRNLSFSIGATPSLSGATVRFKIQLTEDDAGYTTSNTYTSTTGTVSGSSTQVMSFDVPGTTTDDMSEGWHDYEVEATLSSGHVTTLVRGRVNALSQVS